MSKAMTDEEYLRAGGWQPAEYSKGHWWRNGCGLPLAEAVETQLAEDRARYNFVRERSEMMSGMLVPRC